MSDSKERKQQKKTSHSGVMVASSKIGTRRRPSDSNGKLRNAKFLNFREIDGLETRIRSLHPEGLGTILDKIVTQHNFIVSGLILPITLHDGAS